MNDKPRKHWLATGSRTACIAVAVLLVGLYFGSYHLMLVDESKSILPFSPDTSGPVIIPPFPRPAYGEKYKIDGEGVRLFYWPANRLHRIVLRVLP